MTRILLAALLGLAPPPPDPFAGGDASANPEPTAPPQPVAPAPAQPGYAEPAPAQPGHAAPAPAQPGYAEPAPAAASQPSYAAPQPGYEATPPGYTAPEPAATGPVAIGPTETGLGLLIAGPLTTALGIPFSFLGNAAWRDNCGPTNSDRQCADGSLASAGAHTVTGMLYTAGIVMTGVGGARRGQYAAAQDPTREGVGYVIGGAVLLPASLIGMGMTRLFLWLPTPDCLTYQCVQQYQHLSTIIVGGLGVSASLGAGMLMYGISYNRARPRLRTQVAVLPMASRHYAGLSLTGRF